MDCPDIPLHFTFDHGPTSRLCKSCIDGGFTSVMIDALGHHLKRILKLLRGCGLCISMAL